MSSTVFKRAVRRHFGSREKSIWVARQLTGLLKWTLGGVALALGLAGCGGGGVATPTAAASAPPDQVAAFALTQESVTRQMAPRQALAASPEGANLVFNGGFESGTTGWVNWGNANVVSGQASSGTSVLGVGAAAGGAAQDVAGIVAGRTYRLTAQARVSVVTEPVYVGVNFLDVSGEPITQNAVLITSAVYTTATVEAVAPPNAARALVYVWKNAGTGLAYVDDFAFGLAGGAARAPASSGNVVANGGFENGLANWVNWGNGTSTDHAAAGASAAQVGTGAGGFGQQVGAVVAGNTYRLGALAKVSDPGEIGYLGVLFTDDFGIGLGVQSVLFRGTAYSATLADVTPPANATKALVFVWKNAGGGFAFVDEVALSGTGVGTPPPPPPPVDETAPGPETVAAAPVGSPVFQLPWGGAMSGSVYSKWNVLRRYSTAGVQVGTATPFNFPESGGSATVLEGGGYASIWIASVAPLLPLYSYRLYTQAYTATGQPIGSPFLIALTRVADNNPAAVPHHAPLAGGGYVVAWALQQEEPGGANDRGVYTQRFDASGQPAGPAQQATADGAGFLHITGTTTGGYVVSWGELTGTVGGARAYGADGAPLAPEQVAGDSWDVGAGPRGAMAPLAGGGAAIAWQVQNQPVSVQHISASGVALPAQVASSLTSPNRALVTIAGLPDGGSVVAWVELFGGNVYARRFAADGTPRGPQTRINLVTTPTNATEILVLADGRFTIAWDIGGSRYARTFPAGGLVAP